MYKVILENTLTVLNNLNMPIPERGMIAGCGISYDDYSVSSKMSNLDNLHFPMGTAFLNLGVLGIAKRAKASAGAEKNSTSREMFEGIHLVYCELSEYFKKYSQAILDASNGDERLLHIAENLKYLSHSAPVHFDQALQLYALLWSIRSVPSTGSTLGRLDVHLKPFFEKDIESGYINEEKALELLCDFWKLLNYKHCGDTLNNVMVGGRNADGTDAGSRLSVLMLEATKKCAMSEPHINVRVHDNLSSEIYHAMLEVQQMGQGQATAYNDEIIIPGLVKFGIPEEYACTYINDGCYEVMLDGYSDVNFTHIDAVAVFELAFNNGEWAERNYSSPIKYRYEKDPLKDYVLDAKPGMPTGKIEDCSCYEEFYKQFLAQYKYQTKRRFDFLKKRFTERSANAYTSLFLNGTYDCVLDSGKDLLGGALPVYVHMLFSGSVTTVADCLMAIKKLVFEEKKYTIADIKKAISVDFEGYEEMRLDMCNVEKFGNDIDEVDLIAADISDDFCKWLEDFSTEENFPVMPALLGWKFLQEAYSIAATPDGRHFKDPIAEHYCATPGKGVNGPTAIINSIAKSKNAIAKAIGVCGVHITLPDLPKGENGLIILDTIVKTAFEKGLNQINIAIYDAQLLRKAQREPEKHKDIIVRVWGYCARFVDLCKEMQEHIISRVSK